MTTSLAKWYVVLASRSVLPNHFQLRMPKNATEDKETMDYWFNHLLVDDFYDGDAGE